MAKITNSTCQIGTVLKSSSKFILEWLKDQEYVKEESLTDWLLFSISKQIDTIKYHLFSKQEEGKRTGADWEWWFVSDKYAIGFRVQAKKLSDTTSNYQKLAYPKASGSQITKLIQDATSKGLGAIYAFYAKNVKQVRCLKNITDEGVYIASASEVNLEFVKPGSSAVSMNDITSISIPLSCIANCPIPKHRWRGNDSVQQIFNFIEYYFDNARSGSGRNSKTSCMPRLFDSPPEYVSALLEPEDKQNVWENKSDDDINDVTALLVFDYRKTNRD